MHICISKLTIIDIGLLPGLRQAIIWTNAGILLILTLGTKLQWNQQNSYIFIQENTSKNVVGEMAVALSQPQCVKQNISDWVCERVVCKMLAVFIYLNWLNVYRVKQKTVHGKRWYSVVVLTHCVLFTPYSDINLVNTDSGNSLMPDGTKPLPDPMMTKSWLIISMVQRHSSEGNFTIDTLTINR